MSFAHRASTRGRPAARRRLAIRQLLVLALLIAGAPIGPSAGAQEGMLEPLRVRAHLAAGTMISADQAGKLGYGTFGVLLGGQVGWALLPWLEPQISLATAGFPSDTGGATGGLLAPMAGVLVGTTSRSLRPYAHVDVGAGFTGALTRPVFRVGIGVDFRLSNTFTFGPVLGYSQIFHPNAVGNTTDARFPWLGVSVLFRPGPPDPPPPPPLRILQYERVRVRVPAPDPSPEPPTQTPPSPELMVLIEEVMPDKKIELLAPVLFKFDSDELEPVGVAMLHEVARELGKRTEIELVEIEGYADSRGGSEYNVELSARRATRVLEWLAEHGVDRARLQLAAKGATEPVQSGETEPDHEQNRRVVFRVLRMRQP